MLALALIAFRGIAREYKLVVKGKTDARIQMNPCPSAPEFRAASEIQDYVKKISGAEMVRSTYPAIHQRINGNPDFIEILPVTLENGKYLMPPGMYAKLSEATSDEAFYIMTDGNRIVIGAKKPIGVLYGAYTFIEKYLGVRWFYPGNDGEYCPKSPDISLGDIDDYEEPSIPERAIGCWEQSVKPWDMEEVRVWQARNKLMFGSSYQYNDKRRAELDAFECGNCPPGGGGHSTFESSVPQKLFKTHPEYFPLKDGKRVCEERSQRCLANPDVQKMVADYVLAMASYGAAFTIAYHDSGFECFCHCPDCIKMGTYKGEFTVSNLAHRFSSMIADQTLKRNPQAVLGVYIYSVYRDLPTDPAIRYDPRVSGTYCPHQRCYVHRLDDPKSECNVRFFKELTGWQERCSKIGIFDYYAYSQSPYAPMEYTLAEDIKLYKKLNLQRWYDDCTNKNLPILPGNWQFYYVAAKMLWDASLDVDKLMLDAYNKYYGAAAEPMKKYQAFRRELWESAPGHAAYGGPNRIAYCLTVEGAEKRLNDYLDDADKLAGADPVMKSRIGVDRRFLNQFWVKEAEAVKKQMAGQNNIPVRNLEGMITIDGVLDEEDWRKAPLVTGFLTTDEKGKPIEDTRVKVLYDNANWYIGIEALTEHSWSAVKAEIKERDGAVWSDDDVEIFIMPPKSDYYHWAINSIGTFYDARVRSLEFDSKAEIKTKVLKDRYIVEVRIPVEPMGTKISDGQVWQMHFTRSCRNLQPPKTEECSGLDGTPPHEQTRFRRALIGKGAIANGNFEKIATDEKTGKRFPANWGCNQAVLIAGAQNRNQVEIKDGIYSCMTIPASESGNLIVGEIVAAGSGKLIVSASTCVRLPGDKRGFGHEIKHIVETEPLGEAPKPYPFDFRLLPYETGYIYINVKDGKAVVDCINAARKRTPA